MDNFLSLFKDIFRFFEVFRYKTLVHKYKGFLSLKNTKKVYELIV